MTRPGLFVSFEGTEGSGKSTQMRLLVERLRAEGQTVVVNQEPGATEIGKQIRRILLDPANVEMASMTELLLMFASRAQAAAEIILPALDRGHIVVSDRFTDSSLAYQGAARGIGMETVQAVHRVAVGSLLPDLTVCIDLDIPTGLARANRRNQGANGKANEARIDSQSLDFHRSVGQAYQKIARAEPDRFRLIDGAGEPAVVAKRVWEVVSPIVSRLYAHVERRS